MTIKVIDLLVKIANNEDVPKKIIWRKEIFEYIKCNKIYNNENNT